METAHQMLGLSLSQAFHSHDESVPAPTESRLNRVTVSMSVFDVNQPKLK
jgi:hypothetical protein